MNLVTLAVAFRIGPLTVRWYGIFIACAMLIGVILAFKEAQRQHLSADHLSNIVLLAIPSAVIGARLYYVIFRWDWYGAHPEEILRIWSGGLAIHGGIILAVIVVLLYCHAKKLNFLQWADVMVPSLALGQAIGRWGNFANVEAYGAVIEEGSFWSWVPMQVYVDGAYHHPTFLYESIWDLLIFITLLILLRRPHRLGSIFADYLIFYSLGRFFIEQLRTDSLMIGPLRTAVVVSVLGLIIGVLILWRIEKQPRINVADPPPNNSGQRKKHASPSKKRK